MAVNDWLGIGGVFVAFILWCARLEAKVKQNTDDNVRLQMQHDLLARKHDKLDEKVMEKLSEMSNTLARIEERISIMQTKTKE